MSKQAPNPLPQSNPPNSGAGESPPLSSLEEVRKSLQSFGYLDNRIGRFYLASLSRTASQFLNRCLLSLRVGLLAGTLAAVLMTAGTLIFNRDLFKNKPDLLLLFFYFEVFFLLLFSFLELLLIYLVSAWLRFAGGRRLLPAGQAVSFLIGLGFFAYFFYWGRTQIEYLRLLSNASITTMFLVLFLSSIFVAKCSWLGFLVAFQESEVPRIFANWKRYSVEVALSLAVVVVLLAFVLGREQAPTQGEVPVAVLTTTDRWIVVGVDGVSEELLRRLMQSGEAPYLKVLSEESLVVRLQVDEPVVPPVAWTTIGTGVVPAQHGILLPEVRRWRGLRSWMQITPLQLAFHSILIHAGFGQRQPVSGYLRKARTFWEILSDHGIRTGVANWWGSWPAQPMRGWNISERYYYKLVSHGKAQEETYPLDLFQKYGSHTVQLNGPELDRFYGRIFQEQLKNDPVRLAALYLPGFDILNYEFFEQKKMDPFVYTEQYRTHLRWLEETIRNIVETNSGYHLMLILYQGRSLKNNHSAVWFHDVNGNAWRSSGGKGIQTVSEAEIMPLLLYTCGLPVSSVMSTRLISAVVPQTRLAAMPIQFVPSYAKKAVSIESAHVGEFNDLLVEQMKSLGYLQ